MMGIAIRRESSQGVSEVNQAVNVMDFFQTQILPELTDSNHSVRPVLKATSIKFVSVFRNQFEVQRLVAIMPLLILHLNSTVVVVHTFAAYTIERILVTKEATSSVVVLGKTKFGGTQLQQFLEPLFSGLFTIVDKSENEHVMKCVMRSLATAGESIVPVTQIVITKLTDVLGRVAKNPQNPQFNHYLFESIAILVRSVCSRDAAATSLFEPLLFVPFNAILQQDIAEFTPYVFQILAQLLEYRPAGSGLGDAYSQLFDPLLTPILWEKKGNVPALVRLFQAYIEKAAVELVPKLNPILGVFQKLLASKATETNAFDILNSATIHFPQASMEPTHPTLFQLLLIRLQSGKTVKYTRLVTTFFALFVGKYGAQTFCDRVDSMQPNLCKMLIGQVWTPRLLTDPPLNKIEGKIQVVGVTKLLCESQTILSDSELWSNLFLAVATLIKSGALNATTVDNSADDFEFEVSYDAQFSKLMFASKVAEDPFTEVPDATSFFLKSLHQLLSLHPGRFQPLIQQSLTSNPELSVGLTAMFNEAGLT